MSLAPSYAQRSSVIGLHRHRARSAESVPCTLLSLSQPTRQAGDIEDMQYINKNSWNLKKNYAKDM